MTTTVPKATVRDLMDSLGMGYAFAVGEVVTSLHQASIQEKRADEVFWLTQALNAVDVLRGFSTIPSFPIPLAKLDFLSSLVLPPAYAKVLSALWMRPGQVATLRAAVEALLSAAVQDPGDGS